MNTATHPEIIGLDVSRDWLDIHCLGDGHQFRLPNTDDGHSDLEEIAVGRNTLVCFKAAGGQEWRLWASLEAAGIQARQLPPAQAEAFGRSRGTLAKTDRIDAELIARFMAFRPEVSRRLLRGKLRDLRTLTAKRKQFVEMRKSAQQQTKANLKNGTAGQVEDLTDELLQLLERQIAEMPELGQISGEQAAALAGLAPIASTDSVSSRACRFISQHGLESLR